MLHKKTLVLSFMKKSQIKVMKMFSVIPQMKKVLLGVTVRDKHLGMISIFWGTLTTLKVPQNFMPRQLIQGSSKLQILKLGNQKIL